MTSMLTVHGAPASRGLSEYRPDAQGWQAGHAIRPYDYHRMTDSSLSYLTAEAKARVEIDRTLVAAGRHYVEDTTPWTR